MNKKLETFYHKLSNRQNSSNAFNPYLDRRLLSNLRHYIDFVFSSNKDISFFIGEAPGYKGCRKTGIPFTSSELIRSSKHEVFVQLNSKLFFEFDCKENTASIFWSTINNSGPFPLLWNAFPFHPHRPGMMHSNRAPTVDELEEGKIYLELLLEAMRPKKVFAIGRSAEKSLKTYFPQIDCIYIRHPSYGGKNEFVSAMENILNNFPT